MAIKACWVMGSAATVAMLGVGVDARRQSGAMIRDAGGAVACVVSAPAARIDAGSSDSDRLTVELRAPATPPSTITSRLPASKRDFSSVPIDVHLVPSMTLGATE